MFIFYDYQVTTMCFYGLTMVASEIGDNMFLNFILVLGIELPAILFATYGLDRFGRKPLLGMVSHKKSLITIFGYKYKIKISSKKLGRSIE